MVAFIIRRIFQAILVMLVVALISFALFRFVGDPVNQMVGIETTIADREALRERLGLNDPIVVQFARFVGNAAQFDFGISYQFKQPVADLLVSRLPATLELSFASAVFALLVGIPMGVYTALRRNSWLSQIFLSVSLIGISLPTFLIGILLIFVFSVHLQWLPSYGRGEVVAVGWWTTGFLTASGLKALILPAITLGLFQMTLIMRHVRSEYMLRGSCAADYIRFSRAPAASVRRAYQLFRPRPQGTPSCRSSHHGPSSRLGDFAFAIIHRDRVPVAPAWGSLFLQAVAERRHPFMAAYL